MAGMIRLRPTQIILTSEEVSKALHKSRPVISESPSFSGPIPWDHNITIRRGRSTKAEKIAQCFDIHEDETIASGVDSGEISDMSDFSFGPILLKRSPSDANTLFAEANSSSEAGDEGSDGDDGEHSSKSTSWDGGGSVKTLTNDISNDDALLHSARIDGSISSTDEHGSAWETLTGHEFSKLQDDGFIDIEYLADVELSVAGDDGLSGQDSDMGDHGQESYSLPMDGATERIIREGFADMHLCASPISPSQDNDRFYSRESPSSWIPGTLGTLGGVPIPLTQSSVRRLLREVSPRLESVAGLSPRHVAVSRARLARYRSRSLQSSALPRQTHTWGEVNHHRRSHTSDVSNRPFLNNSSQTAHPKCCEIKLEIVPSTGEPSELCIDNRGGSTIIMGHGSRIADSGDEEGDDGGDGEGGDGTDGDIEDAARKLFG